VREGHHTTAEPLARRLDLDAWPGRDRRNPRRSDRNYLVLSALSRAIAAQVERRFAGRTDLRVLDVGCGAKPYLPLVAERAASYRGLDSEPGPFVDDVGPAEELPYDDESFDLVLCTQVLEHLFEPAAAVREIHRVLAPGGCALVSTHGVHVYHPDPPPDQDFWRWTHSGLARLFRTSADWADLDVVPNRNVIACLAALTCWYLDGQAKRLRVGRLGGIAIATINAVAEWLDERYPPTLRVPNAGSLSANYLVAAAKAAG
jgi:SAM-dependent methyltransferase